MYLSGLCICVLQVRGLQWDCCVQQGWVGECVCGGGGCSQLGTREAHAHRRQNSPEITSNSCAGRWEEEGEGGEVDGMN